MSKSKITYKPKNYLGRWNYTEDGILPDSDRKVFILYEYEYNMLAPTKITIAISNFSPSNGWSSIGAIVAWKEIDEETRSIMDKFTTGTFKHEDK